MKEETTTYKVCTACKQKKPLSDFYHNCATKDGYMTQCKECMRSIQKKKLASETEEDRRRRLEKYRQRYQQADKSELSKYTKANYYNTDYLEKKYLKRYQRSLELVIQKKKNLSESTRWKTNPTPAMRGRMKGYDSAIEKWKRKIEEAKELIDSYAQAKKAIQGNNETPSTANIEEKEATIIEKPNIMNKKQLIQLLESVPDHAQIIYVGDQESKSALVATWKPSADTTIVRNIKDNMPFIFAEGKLFELVSASVGETDPAKEA